VTTLQDTPVPPASTRPRERLVWTARRWWSEAVVSRWLIVQHLRLMGPGTASALLVVNLALGLLPVGFILGTSVLLGQVPDAVRDGTGSAAWNELVVTFLLASAAFVGQQVLTPVRNALGEFGRRRVDGWVEDQIILLALRSPSISPLENQEALNALKQATYRFDAGWQTPGMACSGLLALVARYTQLLGLVAVVGAVLTWWAGLALFASVMIFRYGQQGGHRKYSRTWAKVMPQIRESDYLRGLGTGASAAKEVRVFGLVDWVGRRYERAARSWLAEIWAARRRVYLYPYLGYTALGWTVSAAVLAVLGHRAATGHLHLTALALGVQATLTAVQLGSHFPEADLHTVMGMQSIRSLRRFDTLAEASTTPPSSPLPSTTRTDGTSSTVPGTSAAGRSIPATSAGALPVDPQAPRTAVRFVDLSFRYPGRERSVLDGLTLELPAGTCTAVVGVNGAGKTTLVKLLTRLYEPTGGRIELDGVPIADLDLDQWRRQVSVIFQDFVRYELSAADNIALGAVHAPRDPDVLTEAAGAAGILDTLSALPLGLDTPLARTRTGGTELSGGQWQRIAIARSLYALRSGARLLVLDEPTSALDVRAEAAFFDEFVSLTRGVTSLLISHRFSSVRRADRIVVIEGGRVIEQGDHDDLMAADGRYAELFRLQAQRFAEGLPAEDEEEEAPR